MGYSYVVYFVFIFLLIILKFSEIFPDDPLLTAPSANHDNVSTESVNQPVDQNTNTEQLGTPIHDVSPTNSEEKTGKQTSNFIMKDIGIILIYLFVILYNQTNINILLVPFCSCGKVCVRLWS